MTFLNVCQRAAYSFLILNAHVWKKVCSLHWVTLFKEITIDKWKQISNEKSVTLCILSEDRASCLIFAASLNRISGIWLSPN